MTISDVKEAFLACDYPFYKQITIECNEAVCILYSLHSSCQKPITLQLSSRDALMHQIAVEIIKLRCLELQIHQNNLVQKAS
ncbi:hypothetical protein [Brevibacillus centrosporus]|uniref:hypothetical protein n=1 Tax=Brevibacillus centrosporus TaxID=54910 RepID=UPI002E1F0525|nr:hypothetical protein [Brevibacillus centrosporus]